MDTIKNLPSRQVAWVSHEVLDWETSTETMLCGRSSWKSHYDPWKDANDRLADGAPEQARASAILQLRRAVEFRDNALKDTYSLDKIPGFEGTACHNILLDLQIILPIMRKHLINIRNDISHDDAKKPPDVNRCRELAEFTWYFLKSTDHLLSSPIGTLAFDSLDDDLGSCAISVEFDSWSIYLTGKLDKRLVKQKGGIGDFKVDISKATIDENHVYISDNARMRGSRCILNRESIMKFLKRYFTTRY